MKTFLANLQHATHGTQCTNIGGGSFSPSELQVIIETIHDMTTALAAMAFTIETVAHLRGMELELLPVADKARAILARVQSS